MEDEILTEAQEQEALRNAKPSWLTDGKGVKGDSSLVYSSRSPFLTGSSEFQRSTQNVDQKSQAPQLFDMPNPPEAKQPIAQGGAVSTATFTAQCVEVSGGGTVSSNKDFLTP